MGDAPAAAAPPPCCVCGAPNGKKCTKCKSRHYCSKACQLVDWKRGHSKACRQLAADFQDRLLDTLMPAKLKIKEEPAIVEDVSPADGAKARLPAVQAAKTAEAIALSDDAPDWRGTCAICLDVLPLEGNRQTFYECCCKKICKDCHVKCFEHDTRCPLCRAPARTSDAEWLRRLQKHVDKGNAEAQVILGTRYFYGATGETKLQQDFKRAVQLFERAAAQGNAEAQDDLGLCYAHGQGVEIDHEAAAQLFQRAAEQGYPLAHYNLGNAFYEGKGVAQSYAEAVKCYRLAAAQGHPNALFNLGVCHADGIGVAQSYDEAVKWYRLAVAQDHAGALFNLGMCHVPQDLDEALRLFERAAAKGDTRAATAVAAFEAAFASARAV
jgi:hypothetical protein